MKSLFLVTLICAISLPAFAQKMYRWVDAEGNVQFTQTPPPVGIQSEEKPLVIPKPSNPSSATPEIKPAEKNNSVAETNAETPAENANPTEKALAVRKENCLKAQQHISQLQSSNASALAITDPNDPTKLIKLTEEKRQEEVANAEGYIKANCQDIESPQ